MEPMIEVLESVWESIATACDGISEDEWDRPTDCPGWTVKDHVAHMIGTESMLLGRTPPEGEVEGDHLRNDIGRFNEQWVQGFRGRSGAAVLDEFEVVTGERLAVLQAMTPEEWDEEGFTPEGKAPYRTFMEIRAFDCWFHEQDIREALSRPGSFDDAAADHAVGRIRLGMGYVVGKKAGAPDGTTVVFDITGGSPLQIAVGVDGRAALLEASPEDPTVRLTMDRRAFSRLAGGRRPGAWALDAGLVKITGDEALGRAVVENLAYTI